MSIRSILGAIFHLFDDSVHTEIVPGTENTYGIGLQMKRECNLQTTYKVQGEKNMSYTDTHSGNFNKITCKFWHILRGGFGSMKLIIFELLSLLTPSVLILLCFSFR